jgi:flagellar protein FlaG
MTNDISAINQAKAAGHTVTPVAASSPASASKAPAAAQTSADAAKQEAAPKPEFVPSVSAEEMRENLREAIKRLNEMMREGSRDLNFSMDEATDRVVITVKNASTGEVVRQIPDATLLKVAHNIENLKGVLHNQST